MTQLYGASGIRVELESKVEPVEMEQDRHPEALSVSEATSHSLDSLDS
jgi:hypothetical protein